MMRKLVDSILEKHSMIEKELSNFDGTWLTINMNPYLEVCLRISTWSEGLNVQYQEGESWHNSLHDPNIPIFNKSDYESDHPVRSFIERIPDDVLTKVKQFNMNQLTMMRLLKAYPISIDILEHSPSVYCMFADWVQSNEVQITEAVTVLKQKRRNILEIIFNKPVREASVRFLNKHIANGHDRLELDTLKKACLDSRLLEGFNRIDSLGWNELRMAVRFQFLISNQFFWDAVQNGVEVSYLQSKLRDIKSLAEQLETSDYQASIERCQTVEDLTNLHDRWTERLYEVDDEDIERRFLSRYGTQLFPEPPIPGNNDIIPIVTSSELFKEVQRLNCFAETVVNEIINDEIFIYKVCRPERGTIELRIENEKPMKCNFISALNSSPSLDTKNMIHEWLCSHINGLGNEIDIS